MTLRIAAAAVAAALLAYLPFLGLPFISDDYTQIRHAREYGALSGWAALAGDALYRARATSLLLSGAVDAAFGLSPLAHHAASLALHMLNSLLVGLLGLWRPIGFRVSVPAALFFAVYEGHQEAVVWIASVHELLAFGFVAGSFLAWVSWLERGGWSKGALAAGLFGLALFSKESAVAALPALGLAWRVERPRRKAPLAALAALGAGAALYAAAIFSAPGEHLHLNDGTFDLRAPFWVTAPNSLARMLWIWGLAALAALWRWGGREDWRRAGFAVAWMAAALAPYSFLTYMNRVPSRHTYLAAAGLALLVGTAWRTLPGRRWAAAAAAAMLLHNTGYLWVRKLPQYERRAEATVRFLEFAKQSGGRVHVECAPYEPRVLADAAHVALGWPLEAVTGGGPAPEGAARYCDQDHP
jgi:hypothetical protein